MATNPQIILIDGPAGAGKTTFAFDLQKELGCQIVHLDSIYDGWDNALSHSLRDKLISIVSNFLKGKRNEIEIYNWQESKIDSKLVIEPGKHLIIEGVGAGQSVIQIGRAHV